VLRVHFLNFCIVIIDILTFFEITVMGQNYLLYQQPMRIKVNVPYGFCMYKSAPPQGFPLFLFLVLSE
jgi:hypothetical protein